MSIYKMGQYRFNGKDSCLSLINNTKLVEWPSSAYNRSFTDVAIALSEGTFSRDKDYYISLSVPRDLYYTTRFNLKLVKKEDDIDSQSDITYFQWLDSEEIDGIMGEAGLDVTVVIFQNPFSVDEDIIAAIPKVVGSIPSAVEAYSLYRVGDAYYYAAADPADSDDLCKEVVKYRESLVFTDWDSSTDDIEIGYVNFDVAFRPIETGFTHLVIEIERTGDDFNMETPMFDENGDFSRLNYGRVIDIDNVKYELYEIKNFIGDEYAISPTPLTHIGVWGKPGTLMCVNGEPIRIGPRGYYEQDSIPITSIGVVAENHSKMFTIDYKYETE